MLNNTAAQWRSDKNIQNGFCAVFREFTLSILTPRNTSPALDLVSGFKSLPVG